MRQTAKIRCVAIRRVFMQKVRIYNVRLLAEEEILAVSGGTLVISGTVTNLSIGIGPGSSSVAANGTATSVAGANGIAEEFPGTRNVLLIL
jgi:hypothetical protein